MVEPCAHNIPISKNTYHCGVLIRSICHDERANVIGEHFLRGFLESCSDSNRNHMFARELSNSHSGIPLKIINACHSRECYEYQCGWRSRVNRVN